MHLQEHRAASLGRLAQQSQPAVITEAEAIALQLFGVEDARQHRGGRAGLNVAWIERSVLSFADPSGLRRCAPSRDAGHVPRNPGSRRAARSLGRLMGVVQGTQPSLPRPAAAGGRHAGAAAGLTVGTAVGADSLRQGSHDMKRDGGGRSAHGEELAWPLPPRATQLLRSDPATPGPPCLQRSLPIPLIGSSWLSTAWSPPRPWPLPLRYRSSAG